MSFAALLQTADDAVLDHLGDEAIVYTPGVGAAASVAGVYDEAYNKVERGEAGVSSTSPAVFLRLADLPSDPVADTAATVSVNGEEFSITEAKPDGKGMVLLLLNRVAL